PLMLMVYQRIQSGYDIFDSAYDAKEIKYLPIRPKFHQVQPPHYTLSNALLHYDVFVRLV
ncbi:MAG: hypothetical protein WCJ56_15580, partial [bacterium]